MIDGTLGIQPTIITNFSFWHIHSGDQYYLSVGSDATIFIK